MISALRKIYSFMTERRCQVAVRLNSIKVLFSVWLYRKLKNQEFREFILRVVNVREAERKIAIYKMFELLIEKGYSRELLQECTPEEIEQMFKTIMSEVRHDTKEE